MNAPHIAISLWHSFYTTGNNTSSQPVFKLIDEGTVSADALWLTRYRFGPGLNVNRNSIQVYKGYIFVTGIKVWTITMMHL